MATYRKHIRYHIDLQLSPKQNLICLLKMMYPTELALSKLSNPEAFIEDGRSRISFCGINVSLVDKHKYGAGQTSFAHYVHIDASNHFEANRRRGRGRHGDTKKKLFRIDKVRGISVTQLKEYFDPLKELVKVKIKSNELQLQEQNLLNEKLREIKSLFGRNDEYYVYSNSTSTLDNPSFNLTFYKLTEDQIKLLSIFVNKLYESAK